MSLRLSAEHTPAPRLRPPAPLLVRPIIFARAFAEYTGLILFPARLHMDRDVESHPFGSSDASVRGAAWRELQTLLGIVLIAAALYWLIRSRQTRSCNLRLSGACGSGLSARSAARFPSTPASPSTGFIYPRRFCFSRSRLRSHASRFRVSRRCSARRSWLRLVRRPHLSLHARLEKSAHFPGTHDCRGWRFSSDVDQSGEPGIA